MSGAKFEEEQAKFGHIKHLSPLMKDDVLYFLPFILMYVGMSVRCCREGNARSSF